MQMTLPDWTSLQAWQRLMAQHGRKEWWISAVRIRVRNTEALQSKTRFSMAAYLEGTQMLNNRIFRKCYS